MGANSSSRRLDGFVLLARDHEALRRLFRDCGRLLASPGSESDKALIAGRICHQFCLHAQIEEEILYPMARSVLQGAAVLDHAELDHRGSREIVARLDEMEPGDPDHDPGLAVLEAYVVPHMLEEEEVLFPALRAAGFDSMALGAQVARRRRVLQGDVTRLGLPPSSPGAPFRPRTSRAI